MKIVKWVLIAVVVYYVFVNWKEYGNNIKQMFGLNPNPRGQ